MEKNYEEYLFTPKCFEKDLKKIFKNIHPNKKKKTLIKGDTDNIIWEISHKNSYAYLTSVYSNLSPGLILDKLKDYHHLKNWFPYVDDIHPLLRISQYCDLLEINVSLPILNYFNILNKIEIIRYWSYNPDEHSYFLMFKTFKDKKFFDNIKNAGFIITLNPDSLTESGCQLTFFIKFKKSKYSSLIDYVYKLVCREFCSSLYSFIGSVKMHKYNVDHYETLTDSPNSSETVDSYKYLIHYFANVQIGEKTTVESSSNKYIVRKFTELDLNNLNIMKSYFEVKNMISNRYGDNFFSENEIIRHVVGLKGDTNKIISYLEDLLNFRKAYSKSEEEILNENKNFISILCQDEYKRPVLMFRLSHINSISFDDKLLKIIIHTFNKAIDLMPVNVDKFIILIDVKNGNLTTTSTDYLKRLFNIFNKFYVERLAEIYIVNKGIFFSCSWKALTPLIEVYCITDKIVICGNYKEELANILAPDKINLI